MAMTRFSAAVVLLQEHRKQKLSKTGMARVQQACAVLGLSDEETKLILCMLDYYSPTTREPNEFLK